MLRIPCPWCGPRAETEFSCGGEGGIVRPAAPESLCDRQWGDYLFMRRNPKGLHHEQWRHASGCGRWFNVLRDTVGYGIHAAWKFGEAAPPSVAAILGAHVTGKAAE